MKYLPKDIYIPKDANRRNLAWKVLELRGRTGKRPHPNRVPKKGTITSRAGVAIWKIGEWKELLVRGNVGEQAFPGARDIHLCLYGFHSSPSISAALSYIKEGQVLALVEWAGQTDFHKQESPGQPAKRASQKMRILHAWAITKEFEELALKHEYVGGEWDPRRYRFKSWRWVFSTSPGILNHLVLKLSSLGGVKPENPKRRSVKCL